MNLNKPCLCGCAAGDHHLDLVIGDLTYCNECPPGTCGQFTGKEKRRG